MDAFLDYFGTMPTWQKVVWVFGMMSFGLILESLKPLVKFDYKRWRHVGTNLVFLSFTFVINFLFGLATVGIFAWIADHEFGLLYLVDLPIWVELVIAVMMFDFIAQYVVHYLLHKYKWMWKFHMIHHSDTKVDVTTGTRHHPGDYVMRETFALFTILITGAPFAYYMVYRICSIVFTYLTHANFELPTAVDRAISWVFISPNMHKFHHHFERPWTDSNFGNMFSFWDRIFGTLVYDDPHKIQYGLDVLDDELDGNIGYQLKVPFDNSIKTDY